MTVKPSHIAAARLKVAIAAKRGESVPDWIRTLAARELSGPVPAAEGPTQAEQPVSAAASEATQLSTNKALGQTTTTEPRVDEPSRAARERASHAQREKADPGDPAATLGRALIASGSYPRAEAAFRDAIQMAPDNPEYRADLGQVLSTLGRYREAEAAFRDAVRLHPDKAEYRAALGRILAAEQWYGDAEAAFRDAIRMAPDNPEYRADLGWALAAAGQYDDAVRAFNEAIRIAPNKREYQAAISHVLSLERRGKEDEATRVSERGTTEPDM